MAKPKVVKLIDAKAKQAAVLLHDGEHAIENAGHLLLEIQADIGKGVEYQALLHKHGIGESTARRAVQFAADADAAKRHREREKDRDAKRNAKRSGPERDPPNKNKGPRLELVKNEESKDPPIPTTEDYQKTMCAHAYEAKVLGQFSYDAPVTEMVLRMVRETAQVWNELLKQLEARYEKAAH